MAKKGYFYSTLRSSLFFYFTHINHYFEFIWFSNSV